MNPHANAPPLPRRSINQSVTLSGPGLFSPLVSVLALRPAPTGTGIHFRRIDLPDQPHIPADARHIAHSQRRDGFGRCTVLLPEQPEPAAPTGIAAPTAAGIHTTEHLLSAIYALGITDLAIELHGAEIPMLDGSALNFVEALLPKVVPIEGTIAPIVLHHPITIHDGAGMIEATPTDHPALQVQYNLDYGPHAPIPPQAARFAIDWTDNQQTHAKRGLRYAEQIAPARTFCTAQEAQAFQAAGFFAHINPNEVLVLGTPPTTPAMRFADEPARHKVLDLIGDLALVGRPIYGNITATRSGHVLNAQLARRLIDAVEH